MVTDNDTLVQCWSVLEHTSSPEESGTLATLSLDRGYWRTSNTSTSIRDCYNAEACEGGVAEMCGHVDCEDGYCAPGYTGPCEPCI